MIQSKPHSKEKEVQRETPRREAKLEPRRERTSTTERRTIPVKKDMKFVSKIKPKEEYHTVEIIRVPSAEGGSYAPIWMCNIPTTLEDFQKRKRHGRDSKML